MQKNYLSVSQDAHKKVWYQLHTVPNTSNWPNVFLLSELLFVSHFQMLTLKSVFHTYGHHNRVDNTFEKQMLLNLLQIQVQGPPLAEF